MSRDVSLRYCIFLKTPLKSGTCKFDCCFFASREIALSVDPNS